MSPGHTRTASDGRTTLSTGAIPIFKLTEVLSDVTSDVRTRSTCDPAQDTDSGAAWAKPGLKFNAKFQASTGAYGYAQRSSDRTAIASGTTKYPSRASRAALGCPMRRQAFARAGCP